MSDKKIIIKNCPCYNNERFLDGFLEDKDTFCTYYSKKCQDCIDCVMKQIVELCKEESSIIQHKQKIKVKGLNKLADKIFELLDIQEVE